VTRGGNTSEVMHKTRVSVVLSGNVNPVFATTGTEFGCEVSIESYQNIIIVERNIVLRQSRKCGLHERFCRQRHIQCVIEQF